MPKPGEPSSPDEPGYTFGAQVVLRTEEEAEKICRRLVAAILTHANQPWDETVERIAGDHIAALKRLIFHAGALQQRIHEDLAAEYRQRLREYYYQRTGVEPPKERLRLRRPGGPYPGPLTDDPPLAPDIPSLPPADERDRSDEAEHPEDVQL